VVTETLADRGLEQLSRCTKWRSAPSLRRILIDLIEEHAGHTGPPTSSESVDGLIGEDPPG
jgi:hypothetical protein